MDRRLPPRAGEWINRDEPVEFAFEGQTYRGFAGDVLSSALWANDVRLLGRSFKYHRPRGVYSMAGHDANVMVEDASRTNMRGDLLSISPGLDVRAVNTIGGLKHDRLRRTQWFSSLLPVGFYYKAFHTPRRLFPFYERQMRAVAGLGRVNLSKQVDATPKDYAFSELLVVGAGPAGLEAAIAAAEQGVDVLLVDEQPRPGGSLAWQWSVDRSASERLADLVTRCQSLENLQLRCATTASGWYADHWVALVDRRRLIKLRTQATLVATGCYEQPAVFQNNDLPGVMLGSAAQRLIHLYAVKPFDRGVVMAANLDGFRVALDLYRAGVDVAAVVDPRPAHQLCEMEKQVVAAGIDVLQQHAICEAIAGPGQARIRGAVVCRLDDHGQPHADSQKQIDCDGISVSVGWAPNGGLVYQASGKFQYCQRIDRLVPSKLPTGVFTAGRINGRANLDDQFADGRRAGLSAAAYLGRYHGEIPASLEVAEEGSESHAYPVFSLNGKKNFVDFDEDVHLADLAAAHQEGYDNIELMKRYTTVGMGPSQGKLSNMNAVRILARLNQQSIDETGTTTSRPFQQPVPLGHLAGRRFHPLRRTPMHEWHRQRQAHMIHAGSWLRPEYYQLTDRDRETCILEEAQHVRRGTGLIDVSTLGKLQISGPDALPFLERIYAGRFSKQAVGRLRYGLACDETGVIIEDGVIARLAEDDFYATATSSGAAAFFREMQRWALLWNMDVQLVNATGQLAAMNIAGPGSRSVLKDLTDLDLDFESFPYLAVRRAIVAETPALLMRVGFVGELGYEVHVPADRGLHVWSALMERGARDEIRPFGVEAQRLLRLEKGHLIVGQDTDALTNPYEADVAWAVAARKQFFVGSRSLRITRQQPPSRQLVGLKFSARQADEHLLPEECNLIIDEGEIAGRITSIAPHSTLGYPVAMAFVRPDLAADGTTVSIRRDDSQMVSAQVAPLPFYDPDNQRQTIADESVDVNSSEKDREPSGRAAPTDARALRHSAIHSETDSPPLSQRLCNDMRVDVAGTSIDQELAAAYTLGLCDASFLIKIGIKGPASQSWIAQHVCDPPSEIYDSRSLDDQGIIIRLGADEYLLESGVTDAAVRAVSTQLDLEPDGVLRVERCDATFFLIGSRASEVLAQTCAVDFRHRNERELVLTRVAGVNCGVLPDPVGDRWACRLWVDYTFAAYLWHQLRQICVELDGKIVGAGCIFSELRE